MRQGWRWFGPDDPVSLEDIRQAGATDIVSALHNKKSKQSGSLNEVRRHKMLCEDASFLWSVCESIPVPTEIKTGTDGAEKATEI
jgi:mannonate dehydratase